MADITRGFDKLFTDSDTNPLIIPQNDLKNHEKIKYHHLVIDSRERNVNRFATPSKYVLPIFEPINDVVSVELLSTNIPFTRYLVHSHNNTIHFTTNDGDEQTAKIPEGDYDASRLAAAITQVLAPSQIACEMNIHTSRLSFSSAFSFQLLFKGDSYVDEDKMDGVRIKDNSASSLLGFTFNDHLSVRDDETNTFRLRAPYPVNLKKDDYMVMKMKDVKIYTANSNSLNKAFAIVCKNPDTSNINYTESLIKRLNPPLSSLRQLSLSFYDFYGNLYDFNNHDHRIELKIGTLKVGRRL